jgi:hypothetical protein
VSVSRGHKIINKRHSERKKWKSRMRGRVRDEEKDLLEERNDRRRAVTDEFKRPLKYKPFYYTHKWRNHISITCDRLKKNLNSTSQPAFTFRVARILCTQF